MAEQFLTLMAELDDAAQRSLCAQRRRKIGVVLGRDTTSCGVCRKLKKLKKSEKNPCKFCPGVVL